MRKNNKQKDYPLKECNFFAEVNHKTKMKFFRIAFLYLLFLTVSILLSAVAVALPNSINIQGKLTNSAGSIQSGTFNFTFRIYDNFTSGNMLYETNITATTDARGVYDIILQNINTTFDAQHYLAVKINNDAEMEPRINLTSVPYSFRANISEDLNKNKSYTVAGLNVTGNITLFDKITFNFGQLIDNLVNGWLRITGNLNVTSSIVASSINATTIQAVTLTDGNVTITGGVVSASQVQVGGGFTSGGLTLDQSGNIITQGDVLFSGNVTVINVTFLSINGSLLPSLDNSFDVGNASLRWRNANFSGTIAASTIDGAIVSINGKLVQVEGDAFKLLNLTNYFGDAAINSSILRIGNYSNLFAPAWNFANNESFVLDNTTIIRTTNLRIALSNNTDANFTNLTVVSLRLGWTNLTNYPPACPAGQFVTTVGNTLTCGIPSGGGSPFNSSSTNVFLNDTIANLGLGLVAPNDKLEVIGNVRISGSLNASSINTTGGAYFAINSGNVGINTTTPANTLTVQGTLNVTSQPTRSGDLFVASSGNVGIGTATPRTRLHVIGNTSTNDLVSEWTDTTPTSYIAFYNPNTGGNAPYSDNSTIKVRGMAGTNNAINVGGNIIASGNVGINTTTPTQLLTVVGGANITGALTVGSCIGCGPYKVNVG